MTAGRALRWIAAFAGWAACIGVIAHYNIAPSLDHGDDASVRAMICVQVLCAILSFASSKLIAADIFQGGRISAFPCLLIVVSVWAGMETGNRINEARTARTRTRLLRLSDTRGRLTL